jgi:hypothetical protein
MTLRGANIADEFKTLVADYIEQRFGKGSNADKDINARGG